MKKYAKILASALAVITVATGVGAAAQQAVGGVTKVNYQFEMEGKNIQVPSNLMVLSKDNSTYVPLRFLSETMGATVGFNQGRITIKGIGKVDETTATDTDKIKSLERQVELLKKENAELQNQIRSIDSSMNYKTLPVAVDSINNLNFRLLDIRQGSDYATFSVEFTNKNKDGKYFIVDPFKTKVFVEGKEYNAILATDANLNSTLNQEGSRLSGDIVIGKLDTTKIKGAITFTFNDNGDKTDTVTLYFDNTK